MTKQQLIFPQKAGFITCPNVTTLLVDDPGFLEWRALYPNFTPQELACKGTRELKIHESVMYNLQYLREVWCKPIRITSGYRAPSYNASVSSTGVDGPHTTGYAVDIGVERADAHDLLLHLFGLNGLEEPTGIGIQQKGNGRFIHLDWIPPGTTKHPRPTIWSY